MTSQWHGGKGSAPRKSNDQKQYEDNWQKIFGKNKKQPHDPDYDPADTEWEDLADD